MVKTLSISFRSDELQRITELMTEYGMNRHQVIKLAVRRFLFPHEKTVPLDGRKLSCIVEQEKKETPPKTDDVFDLLFGKTDQKSNKTSSNPPFLKEEEDPFP